MSDNHLEAFGLITNDNSIAPSRTPAYTLPQIRAALSLRFAGKDNHDNGKEIFRHHAWPIHDLANPNAPIRLTILWDHICADAFNYLTTLKQRDLNDIMRLSKVLEQRILEALLDQTEQERSKIKAPGKKKDTVTGDAEQPNRALPPIDPWDHAFMSVQQSMENALNIRKSILKALLTLLAKLFCDDSHDIIDKFINSKLVKKEDIQAFARQYNLINKDNNEVTKVMATVIAEQLKLILSNLHKPSGHNDTNPYNNFNLDDAAQLLATTPEDDCHRSITNYQTALMSAITMIIPRFSSGLDREQLWEFILDKTNNNSHLFNQVLDAYQRHYDSSSIVLRNTHAQVNNAHNLLLSALGSAPALNHLSLHN